MIERGKWVWDPLTSTNPVKLDAIDLIMTVLREHEKILDRIVKQLDFLATSLDNTNLRLREEVDFIVNENAATKLQLRIQNDLVQKAQDLGLNIPEIVENALRESVAQNSQ